MQTEISNNNLHLRAITLGLNWEGEQKNLIETQLEQFLKVCKTTANVHNRNVRTYRVALSPINKMQKLSKVAANNVIQWISEICRKNSIRWFCAPIDAVASDHLELDLEVAYETVSRNPNVFLNFIIARDGIIDRKAIYQGAKLVKSVSRIGGTGFENFRVGLSANTHANTPFFPFTHHAGQNGFSIALETPIIFTSLISQCASKDLEAIRNLIIETLSPELRRIESMAHEIEKKTGFEYKGIDVSLAPLPDDQNSVAKIVESLGIEGFGSNGTLFFTSYLKNILTQLIHHSGIKSIGFNGVMYSLLEDSYIGLNNNLKTFSIDSLMSFASVCGCGIDMVPIPGDTFEEEIASLVLDVAGLSTTLKKPLGVRVLPIPMRYENEFTDFSHDFIHNTRIKGIRNRVCQSYVFDGKPFTYLESKK